MANLWFITVAGGVRCYQDSKDWALTANLWHHALRCFGEEAVHNGTKHADNDGTSDSIFSSFVRQGQKPVQYSHRSHTNTEVWYDTFLLLWHVNWLFISAHLVRWITENNQPVHIINDQELCELLTAGWLKIELPGHVTISRDIKACFAKCHDRICKLLQVRNCHPFFSQSELTPYYLQWVKKLSQCLAVLKRLTCRKSSKLCNNVKIIYVILHYLSSYISPRSCDLKQNW